MARITNAVIVERIDGLKDSFNDKIDSLDKNINEHVLPDVKANTEFRQKAKGVIAVISFISAFFGGVVLWISKKLWGGS